jgi:integrase
MPNQIEKFKLMRLKKVTPATINRDIACLKHMFTIANEWQYTKHNPTKGIKLLKEPPGRVRYLDNEEVERLIATSNWPLKTIIIIALNTGMRKGEILGLKWSDIDLKNSLLMVGKTKNNERRIVTINNTLYQEFSNIPRHISSPYVIYNKDGKPFKGVRKSFAAALKRANITDFRFHDLRHTFASHLAMSGVSLKTIQQLLGHKDLSMTMRYAHLSEEYMQNAVKKLDTIWSQEEIGHGTKPVTY